MRARIALLALLALLIASSLSATDWRTYSGGFSSRWKTGGPHGHDQAPCSLRLPAWGMKVPPHVDCDGLDFARGNLDNSIGFRLGRENDFARIGPLRLVGGAEGSVSHTEYNFSQIDVAIVDTSLLAGADVEVLGVRAGIRYGGGVFVTTDARTGLSMHHELSLALPLRSGAALRISRREMDSRRIVNHTPLHERVRATETALMIESTPGRPAAAHWDFSTATGRTRPGGGPGASLALHEAAWQRLSALRDVGSSSTQLEVAWSSTAHESKLLSDYRGYRDNQRGKTINGFGLGLHRTFRARPAWSVRAGGGIEIADWRDPYPLLVARSGREIKGGIETAFTAAGAIRYRLRPGLAIEALAQQLYWRDIHLGETRWGIGIALMR